MFKVLVRNTSDYLLHIACHYQLGHIIDIIHDNYFLVNMQTTFDLKAFLSIASTFLDFSTGFALMPGDISMETQLDNEVIVYGNSAVIEEISKLVAEYLFILEFNIFVQISPEY